MNNTTDNTTSTAMADLDKPTFNSVNQWLLSLEDGERQHVNTLGKWELADKVWEVALAGRAAQPVALSQVLRNAAKGGLPESVSRLLLDAACAVEPYDVTPSPQVADIAELSKAEIDDIVYKCRQQGNDTTYDIVNAAIAASRRAPAPASAGQAAPALADAAGANEMRIALVTQLNELIDLGNRYAGRMRGKDDEESEYAQGACEYARRVMAPYNYNGGYRPTADEQDAKRYRYIATLRDWGDIEQMCWSSTARSASQFKHDLDKYIDAKLVNAAPDQACVMREVAMPKGLTCYSMWSNAAAHGMDPSPSGEWVAFDELQDYIAAQPAEGAGQAECPCPNVQIENHSDGSASCVGKCPGAGQAGQVVKYTMTVGEVGEYELRADGRVIAEIYRNDFAQKILDALRATERAAAPAEQQLEEKGSK